jgi:hypothetical protein
MSLLTAADLAHVTNEAFWPCDQCKPMQHFVHVTNSILSMKPMQHSAHVANSILSM